MAQTLTKTACDIEILINIQIQIYLHFKNCIVYLLAINIIGNIYK